MRELSYHDFTVRSSRKKVLEATAILTYRCNLKCVHCFTDIGFDRRKELSLSAWKKIIDRMYRDGCLWLTFTGGEPLLHKGFLPLYQYAVKKGMRVTVFTNATRMTPAVERVFARYPPFLVEVSIYGASRRVYESVTGVPGSFARAMKSVRRLAALGLPVIIKTMGLRQNRKEVLKIKSFSEKLLGQGKFKFDSFIFPRLNGDTSVCQYRLTPRQIIAIEAHDNDMTRQRIGEVTASSVLRRPADFLYQCASGETSFFIDPDGRLKFCVLSRAYPFGPGRAGLKEAFFRGRALLRKEKFKTGSKCRTCSFRGYCYFCPARAFLETGDQERASGYFCQLARLRKKRYDVLASQLRIKR